jgi:hypothetical protein
VISLHWTAGDLTKITSAEPVARRPATLMHLGAALDASHVRKMFRRICTAAGIGDG